jgi:hypothetical protein
MPRSTLTKEEQGKLFFLKIVTKNRNYFSPPEGKAPFFFTSDKEERR